MRFNTLYTRRDFFPVAISFMRKLPVIGNVLNMPGIAQVSQNNAEGWRAMQQKETNVF
jgi:hypothetical protein